ncbi:MAG: hypothetical protein AB7O26_16990 [Planctomycetaceae bacterium]
MLEPQLLPLTNERPDGQWVALSTPDQRRRFAQIMQFMDDRYKGLELGLDTWLNGLAAAGQQVEIFGWGTSPQFPGDIVQVIALSSRRADDGTRTQPRIRMLGVAPELKSSCSLDDAEIKVWLHRYLRLLQNMLGCPTEFSAMRPKMMSFKPMERLHDLVRLGTTYDTLVGERIVSYAATVVTERDHGETLFWRIQMTEQEN